MSKTVITKIIEKDVVDAPPPAKPKPKKFSFDSEEELEQWIKNKKILVEYPKLKEERDKLKKEKAEKEKAAKEKEKEAFNRWLENEKKKGNAKKEKEQEAFNRWLATEHKKEEEKRQKEAKAFEEWKAKQNKSIKFGKSIENVDGNLLELLTFAVLFITIMIYISLNVAKPKQVDVNDLSLSALRDRR